MAAGSVPASSLVTAQEVTEFHRSLSGRTAEQLLGVSPGAKPGQLKAAFQSLVRRYHPDALGPVDELLRAQAQAIVIALDDAYRLLGSGACEPSVSTHARAAGSLAGEPVPAAAELEQHDESRASRVDQALRSAEMALARSDGDAAVAVLHEVMRLAEGDRRREVEFLLARAYVGNPRWRRYGVELLRSLGDAAPPHHGALLELGRLYCREGLLARAAAAFERAIASDPSDRDARAALERVRLALTERRRPTPRPGGLIRRIFSMKEGD